MVLASLESAGYNNYWAVLNAKHYGVPQNRERVIIVSIRKDIDNGIFKFPEAIPLKRQLKDVLEEVVDEKYYLSDKMIAGFMKHNDNHNAKGTGFLWKPKDGEDIANCLRANASLAPTDNTVGIKQIGQMYQNSGNPQTGRIYDPDGISPTLDTCKGGNRMPKVLVDRHIESFDVYRKLTPKECFRLMDFDDSDFYKAKEALNNAFYKGKDKSDSRLYILTGNSIVVAMLMFIFRQMLDENGDFSV